MGRCACASGCDCAFADSPSVDISGSGSPGDPYLATVIVDAATCEQVQDCVGGILTDGLEYDDAGNEIRARLSTDVGNSMSFGGDGGLFAPVTGLVPVDTNTVDLTLAGPNLTADVILAATHPGLPPGCNGLAVSLPGLSAPPFGPSVLGSSVLTIPDQIASPGGAGVIIPTGAIASVPITNTSCYSMNLLVVVSMGGFVQAGVTAASTGYTSLAIRQRVNAGPWTNNQPLARIGRVSTTGGAQTYLVDAHRTQHWSSLDAFMGGVPLAAGGALLFEYQFIIEYSGTWVVGEDLITGAGAKVTILGVPV